MASDQPQQPAQRRFFIKGLDPVKFAEIEREMEEREQLRRSRVLAQAQPAAVPESQPADSGAMDWGDVAADVAAGLRGLADQLRRATEGPG
jgi:hypothetical protein